jgi:hypothetical protein
MKTQMNHTIWFLALLAFVAAGGWWEFGGSSSEAPAGVGAQVAAPKAPMSLRQLLASSPAQVGQCDIALLNLLCAEGLPGAEKLNPQECMATLDGWAERVRSETERHLYRYRANPWEFESSEGYFRMLMMAVVVYEDFSVRYNPDRLSVPSAQDLNDHFFADSGDLFLHGLLHPASRPSPLVPRPSSPSLGTCSSMPVLYIAIGRRLGYPLRLVTTKAHLFIRWESATERFDLEATGKGMNRYDDEHFKQWPFPVTDDEIKADGYLKSLTPVEELAVFLSLRGHCLREAGRTQEAASAYRAAAGLVPASRAYRLLLADTLGGSLASSAADVPGQRSGVASGLPPEVLSSPPRPGPGPNPDPLARAH